MKKTFRVLMITDQLTSDCGPTTSFLSIYGRLKKLTDTFVLTSDQETTSVASKLEKNKYFFLNISDKFVLGGINILTIIRIFFYLPKLLKEKEIHVLYSFLYSVSLSISVLKKFKIIKQKYIYNFSGPLHLETQSSLQSRGFNIKKKALIFWQFSLLSFIINSADIVIARSNYASKILIEEFNLPKNKIQIIEGIVDRSIFNTNLSGFKKISAFSVKQKMLLIPSRLEYRKGIDIAIIALSQVLKKIESVVLLVVIPKAHFSDTNLLNEYFELIDNHQLAGKVFFTRGVENNQMPELFRQASITLMCSRDLETFGLTTIESLACGTPVVGSDSGATPEILSQIDKKLLFESENSKSLEKKILHVLSLNKEKEKILKQKMQKIVNKYDLFLQTNKIIEVLKD